MRARQLTLAFAAAGLIAAAVPATSSADSRVAVCNEAENSFRGGYVITETTDPRPPASLRGEQMRLGNGHGVGLVNAAAHSPALVVCDGSGAGGGDPMPA